MSTGLQLPEWIIVPAGCPILKPQYPERFHEMNFFKTCPSLEVQISDDVAANCISKLSLYSSDMLQLCSLGYIAHTCCFRN